MGLMKFVTLAFRNVSRVLWSMSKITGCEHDKAELIYKEYF